MKTFTEEKILKCLHKHFGYNSFKPGQLETIKALLKGHSTLSIMPTGGGKSLCFQIPALLLPGVTLVISPLISLMKDQVDKLVEKKIPAGFINSALSSSDYEVTVRRLVRKEIKLLYISPERFYSSSFKNLIKSVPVSLFAIDEAHCISEWGHDFRPSYLKLKSFLSWLDHPVTGAFTATATKEVQNDIITHLELSKPKIIIKGFDRPNIRYLTLSLKEKEKKEEMYRIVSKVNASTIVYCSTKKNAEDASFYLAEKGISSDVYHGGLETFTRNKVQNEFIQNKVQVICATNAFGMGIDKPDVRLILHYNLPGSIEAFYQESGRAGRDGKTAYSVVFGNRKDLSIQKFLIKSSFPSRETIQTVYRFLKNHPYDPVLKTYRDIAVELSNGKKIHELMVGNVLKILESHQLIQRLQEANHPASVFFHISRNRILQRNRTFKTRKKILQYFDTAFGNISSEPVSFWPEHLIKEIKITRDQFSRNIKLLAETGDLSYSPPFLGRGIKKIDTSVSEKQLPIDHKKLEWVKNYQLQKTEAVFQLISTPGCKRRFLLSYFGESYHKENCSGCDFCLKWRQK